MRRQKQKKRDWTEDMDIPSVPRASDYGCVWYGNPNGESYGVCKRCDEEFETREEWDRHQAEEHPLPCSNWSCDRIASYKYQGSPHSYCAKHAQDWEGSYSHIRVDRPANSDAPRLPDDHPMEVVLRGLEGDTLDKSSNQN